MKLLFDNNLSQKLLIYLDDLFPDSSHVTLINLERATDLDVWETAKSENFTIVSKDSDFSELLTLKGFPPKVIWLRIGNCTTHQAAESLRQHSTIIYAFGEDPDTGLLEIL